MTIKKHLSAFQQMGGPFTQLSHDSLLETESLLKQYFSVKAGLFQFVCLCETICKTSKQEMFICCAEKDITCARPKNL